MYNLHFTSHVGAAIPLTGTVRGQLQLLTALLHPKVSHCEGFHFMVNL